MNESTYPTPLPSAPLRLPVHLLIAVTVGIISPFTGLAWPFAILTGILLGSTDAHRHRGKDDGIVDVIASAILVAGGILAMLFFGAIIGGVIALAIVALAAFSEQAAAPTSSTDRGVARILLFVIPVVMWLFVFPALGLEVAINVNV
jgi:hypothetical protein